ncbi:MAG: N-acetylmuramoyl-L-alanine amidase [Microbispora sp.]|nr:N-acetylmuramoyl-L-alanine amidase [Microbispora sp.]
MIKRPLAAAALALCGVGAAACGGAEVSAAGAPAPSASLQVDRPAATQDQTDGTTGRGTSGPGDAETDITTIPGTRTAAETTAKPLTGKVVVIDPGHNGGNFRHTREINQLVDILTEKKACDTTGTSTNDGYSEAAFTWDVSQRLAKLLRAQGATVKLTRTNNTGWGPCITERAAIGNKAHADAAISIHGDGAPPSAHGFHVIMPKRAPGLPVNKVIAESAALGKKVRDAFHEGTGLPYSTYIGSKALNYRSDLGGLNLSTVPKIFIECGNMRNATEAAKFKNKAFRQRIAESLAKGIAAYLTGAR